MRVARNILLTLIFVIALASFAFTYTVRFTEAAVKTEFGKATEASVHRAPGLYFKLPYPIHSVTKYDTRVRLLSMKMEQISTADNRQVVVETFCTWRVEDPLRFFQRFSNSGERAEDHYREAEKALKANLRSAASVISRYRMDELFSSGASSKLPELEKHMLDAFRAASDQSNLKLSDYGIAAADLGLTRVVLTEEVTKAVFDRMKAARERVAKETESSGKSQAQTIRDKAETDARRIAAFADRLAKDIRTRGERESVPYLAAMNTNPELAVFEANMEFIRQAFGKRTTLVLPSSMPGLRLLFPDALEGLKVGQVPTVSDRKWLEQVMANPQADRPTGAEAPR